MTTLIVPCVGRNFIHNQPRWILPYSDSDILLSKCLKVIKAENYDRVVVTILTEDLQYISLNELKYILGSNVEICLIDHLTNGPAETVYYTIETMEIKGAIQIKDIDILFQKAPSMSGNFICGIHLLNYNSDLSAVRSKSFITRNEQNMVMDIIEKTIKSDIICMGLYGFKNSNDFIYAYSKLKENFSSEDTIYVSHVISYLIGVRASVFNYVEIIDYESLETERDYEKSIKSRGVYILDTTKIDIEKNIEKIKQLSQKGADIIVLVTKNNEKEINRILVSQELKCRIVKISDNMHLKYISSDNDLWDVYYNAV